MAGTEAIPAVRSDTLFERRPTTLRFVFGEFCLFKLRIPAIVYSPLFTAEPGDPIDNSLVREHLGSGAAVVLFSSLPIAAQLPVISFADGLIRYVPNQYPRYYIDLRGSFADYHARLSSKTRSNLRASSKKFREMCHEKVRFRIFRTAEEMDEFHRLARQVSAMTYQDKLLGVGLPDTDDFRRKLATMAASSSVLGYVLFDDEEPVAFGYCTIREKLVTWEVTGYDEAYSKASPGTFLLQQMLEHMFAEGRFVCMDFGSGEAPYKARFATGSAHCADIYYFRQSPTGLLIVLLHAGLAQLSRFAVSFLEKLKLKDRLKKAFRRSR